MSGQPCVTARKQRLRVASKGIRATGHGPWKFSLIVTTGTLSFDIPEEPAISDLPLGPVFRLAGVIPNAPHPRRDRDHDWHWYRKLENGLKKMRLKNDAKSARARALVALTLLLVAIEATAVVAASPQHHGGEEGTFGRVSPHQVSEAGRLGDGRGLHYYGAQLQNSGNEALRADSELPHQGIEQLEANNDEDDSAGFGFIDDWNNSLWFETEDGNFRANFGGRVEQDWVWITGDEDLENTVGPLEDGIFFRRARIQGAGRVYGLIDYFAEFEFAAVERIVYQDVWIQLRDVPVLGHIRTGHLKVPFGLENETSARHVTFMERSAVHDAFQQEYDPGIMFWNTVREDNFRYAVALLRFDPLESGRSFGDGEYSMAARLSGVLLHNEDDSRLLHVGGSVRVNNSTFDDGLGFSGVQFRARPELRNTPNFVDTGFFEADNVDFVGAEAAMVLGRFSAQGEYVHAQVDDAFSLAGAPLGNVDFSGYYVYMSYFLTGEHRPYSRSNGSFGRIKPCQNVLPGAGICSFLQGAWELKARYSNVDLTNGGIAGGRLQTATVGLNWYLIPNSKILCDYIWARRDAPVGSGEAHMLGLRFNVEF